MPNEGALEATIGTRIQLCGRFLVRIGDRRIDGALPGRQGRLLFAYLATRPDRSATRDQITEALWPDSLPTAPEAALAALLSKLRRTLGEDRVEGRSEITLRLPMDARIDVETARDSIHRAEALIAMERWHDAAGPTMAAYSISERVFMRGEEAPWIDELRRELEDTYLRAIEAYATIGLGVGGHENPVVAHNAQRLVELAPYRESGYRMLMEAHQRTGNPTEAIRVYERLRIRLRDELGTAPSPELQAFHERLLALG